MRHDVRLTAFLSLPFTLADAAEHGIGPGVVRRWVREGTVRRIIQGVFVADAMPDSPGLRARAAAALVPGAVVCGRTAAWLWGIGAASTHDSRGEPLPVEIIVPRAATPPRRAGCVGRKWTLEKGDTTKVAHVVATTPLRTAADIGRTMARDDAVVLLDAFLHTRQVTVRQLESAVDRFAAHRGVRRLAEAVHLADGRSMGVEETLLRLALASAAVPAPEPGYRVMSAFGRPLHRFAVAWPGLRLGVDVAASPATPPTEPRQPALTGTAMPAIRVRTRVIGGVAWRVIECGEGAVTSHRDTVLAQTLRELRERAGPDSAAA
ncbi:MAG: type IV toxin-antitoxin system AbiEi family antitoxin domain-containing protein [Streptomycetaceae bacterium]|nr:type IV toxin-antitoxin system AbiEi family antitoxin domain-containing protein [Streptomycetaceae bacterium]